ncbi:unnamed protein product [Rotaria magnacalcarata]|uniref:G-protein coupled receptors family 1 profile domain-containing protein n=1 Tax=Rotaria magnacalcarata TaxID=392030 RepID=A0A816EWJ4_9BILA|nr:unnamed protein product [Rotaria magnacalcarata]CAF1654759.1 unnamed protein product [Rotaria magnacalcarata]CAF2087331.1 unnamed protein product [Rotaria magnacalcarata]CAF3835478.1 unnamed protein product [Rotaria magnacalcarata]CAF3971752.1 unnamed protein product [Rotaria magnacalcarata]
MTSPVDAKLIESLTFISDQFNRYLSVIIFIFGVVGNILNCLVLYQKTLRYNTCAAYFLLSSFIDLISILSGLPTRILAGWHFDPTSTIDFICKFRAFMVFSTRTASIWLITLATIDRWLLSSMNVNYRRMSALKNVKKGMSFCLILAVLSYIHVFYCYTANILNGPLPCYAKTVTCRLATDLIYIFLSIIIPLSLMITFGLMTISNVHRVRDRAPHMINLLNRHRPTIRKHMRTRIIDRRLLRMLLMQVSILVLCCIPQAIEKLYITFNSFRSGSELRDVITTFLYNFTVLLAFIQNAVPFYIYTLAGGTIFRTVLTSLIRKVNHNVSVIFC